MNGARMPARTQARCSREAATAVLQPPTELQSHSGDGFRESASEVSGALDREGLFGGSGTSLALVPQTYIVRYHNLFHRYTDIITRVGYNTQGT